MSHAEGAAVQRFELQSMACSILEALVDASPDERRRVLADVSGRDATLHGEVCALLDCLPDEEIDLTPEPPPPAIDEFEIVRELGRGGMGVVYLARRAGEAEEFALKVLKRGMDTEGLIARFHREQEALRRLDDPRIARIHSVGATVDGRPYFVMDLAGGLPITTFCDAHGLSLRDRMVLFREVCAAVAHVHGRQVLHRDIKPGNILVGRSGRPVLVDFGVAKIIDPTDPSTFATTALRPLTVQYASPQQLVGAPPAASDDVYALGLVLYELLVGRPPYTVESTNPIAAAQTVSSAVILPPSLALVRRDVPVTFVGWLRSTPSGALRRQLRGNLDAITMKALDPEDDRRYPSAHSLVEDLTSFLDDRPTDALSRRRLRQYRFATAAATLGVMVGAVGFVQVRADRIEAELAVETTSERYLKSALEDQNLLATTPAPAKDMTRLNELSLAMLDTDADPEMVWAMLDVFSEMAATMGSLRRSGADQASAAVDLLRTIVERRREFVPDDPVLQPLFAECAEAHRIALESQSRGWKNTTRVASLEACLERINGRIADIAGVPSDDLAIFRRMHEQAVAALSICTAAPETARRNLGQPVIDALRRISPMTLRLELQRLGDALCRSGDPAVAMLAYEEALDLVRQFGDLAPGNGLTDVADAADGSGFLDRARDLYEEVRLLRRDELHAALSSGQEVSGATASLMMNFGGTLGRIASIETKRGRHADAVALYREALEWRERVPSGTAKRERRIGLTQYSLVGALLRVDAVAEASAVAAEVEAFFKPDGGLLGAMGQERAAEVNIARGRTDIALDHLDALDRMLGPDPGNELIEGLRCDAALLRAKVLLEHRNGAEALQVLTESLQRLKAFVAKKGAAQRMRLRMARTATQLGIALAGEPELAALRLDWARDILSEEIDREPERADLRHDFIEAAVVRLRIGTEGTRALDLDPLARETQVQIDVLIALYAELGDERRLATLRDQDLEIEAFLEH